MALGLLLALLAVPEARGYEAGADCRLAASALNLLPWVTRFDECGDVAAKIYTFHFENDLFSARVSDRFYTGGMAFDEFFVGHRRGPPQRPRTRMIGATFGFLAYTGADTSQADSLPGDRPWAGYLFWGFRQIALEKNSRAGQERIFGTGLEFGCLGPCSQVDGIQSWSHELATPGAETPQGWDQQFQSELGVTVNLNYLWNWKMWGVDWEQMDYSVSGGVQLGNFFQNVGLGLLVRIALVGGLARFSETGYVGPLPSGYVGTQATVRPVNVRRGVALDFHVFFGASRRWVLYNALLQGGYARNELGWARPDPEAKRRTPEPVVDDWEVGFSLGLGNGFAFQFSRLERSSEIQDTPGGGDLSAEENNHRFGQFQLIWLKGF